MLRQLNMNNPSSAWKHFKKSSYYYTFDEGIIDFRYEDDNNCKVNISINYIETTNNEDFHDLLRTMIDDILNVDVDGTAEFSFGTIIIKKCATNYEELGLDRFIYKNKKFKINDSQFVLVDI